MKQADVKIGGIYYIDDNGNLVAVEVMGVEEDVDFYTKKTKTKYRVRKVGGRFDLPKLRSAAALREEKRKLY